MKYLLLLILFISNLQAHYFIKDYISEDNINFKEASFTEYKTKKIKEFTIKFKIDLEELKNRINYLTIVSDKNSLIYTNANYEIINNTMVIKLDSNQKMNYFFTINMKNQNELNLDGIQLQILNIPIY